MAWTHAAVFKLLALLKPLKNSALCHYAKRPNCIVPTEAKGIARDRPLIAEGVSPPLPYLGEEAGRWKTLAMATQKD